VNVRVGVVGCGWWATSAHLPALEVHPQAQLAALADADPARLSVAARTFGVTQTFANAEQMFDRVELDAVVIAAPHALHHQLAAAALDRGIHVLLEKPMTIDTPQARDLLARARAQQTQLVIGYPWNYNVHTVALREMLHRGDIGEIEHVSCLYASTVRELYRGDPESYRDVLGYPVTPPGEGTYSDPAISGGGQGQTQVTHAAALLLWITGLAVEALSAFTSPFDLPVDLVDAVAIRFHGGALGSLGSTGGLLPGQDEIMRCDVFGREGHVIFDVGAGSASIHRRGAPRALAPLKADQRYPVAAPVGNLIGVALEEEENGSPPEIGLQAVEFVSALYRSAEAGTVVAVADL
jgi:predicted dehydrogenase